MSDEDVQDLLVHHGAGELIIYTADAGLLATLLPFFYDPDDGPMGALHGHFARVNDQWRHEAVGEALVVLDGVVRGLRQSGNARMADEVERRSQTGP